MGKHEPKRELTYRQHRSGRNQSFWDQQLRGQISRDLRALFESSLTEPLPERLSSPLLQMETARKARPPFDL